MEINITLTKTHISSSSKKKRVLFFNESQVKLHFLNIYMEKPALKISKIITKIAALNENTQKNIWTTIYQKSRVRILIFLICTRGLCTVLPHKGSQCLFDISTLHLCKQTLSFPSILLLIWSCAVNSYFIVFTSLEPTTKKREKLGRIQMTTRKWDYW